MENLVLCGCLSEGVFDSPSGFPNIDGLSGEDRQWWRGFAHDRTSCQRHGANCTPRGAVIRPEALRPYLDQSRHRPAALRPTLSSGLPFSGMNRFLGEQNTCRPSKSDKHLILKEYYRQRPVCPTPVSELLSYISDFFSPQNTLPPSGSVRYHRAFTTLTVFLLHLHTPATEQQTVTAGDTPSHAQNP